MFNNYQRKIDEADNQLKKWEDIKQGYQNMQSQSMIVLNVGNQINFEAHILNENENPNEILIQHRTMFFDNRKGKLYIKEINGDLVEYDVILPKDEKDLRIEELERRLSEYEHSNTNGNGTTDEENEKLSKSNDTITTKSSK